MKHFRLPTLLLCLGLAACDNPPAPDAGTDAPAGDTPMAPDAPRDTPPARPVCDGIRSVTLTAGMNNVTGDTTGRGSDLDLSCGGMDPGPQEAVEITLPGSPSDTVGLRLSLVTAGTSMDFDTVLEVRSDCTTAVDAACGDDVSRDELRSEVMTTAPGGSTRTVIVSGYDADNSGPWSLDIEVIDGLEAPTLTGATALMVATSATAYELRLDVMGGDADGDASGAIFELLDGAGAVIGADSDGDTATPDQTEFGYFFADSVEGMTTFTGRVGPIDELGMGIPLSDFPAVVGAAQLRVRLFDEFDLESAPMTFPIGDATLVRRGESCDATHVCPLVLECGGGATCAVPAAVATACGTASAVTLTAPTGSTSTVMTVDGTIMPGDGVIRATCQGATRGRELLYTVAVPAGTFDLEVTTAGTRTGTADTVVYAMTTCGDTSADPATFCHDDVDYPDDVSSIVTIENATGTYTVAVDLYTPTPITADVAVGTTFRLRPVLATGAMCDPAGVENRCAGGACSTTTMMCP